MKWLIGILVVVAAAYAGYHYRYPSTQLNFRTTIEVETPEGVRTGSGVVEGHYGLVPNLSNYLIGFASGMRGEAVAVDLGARGVLFALLQTKLNEDTPLQIEYLKVLAYDVIQATRTRETIRKIGALSGSAVLDADHVPLLVRFRDIADPKSVERIDPKDLAASFGPGVRLKRITIETTRDPATTGIEKRLAWLPTVYVGSLDGSRGTIVGPRATLVNSLNYGYFLRNPR